MGFPLKAIKAKPPFDDVNIADASPSKDRTYQFFRRPLFSEKLHCRCRVRSVSGAPDLKVQTPLITFFKKGFPKSGSGIHRRLYAPSLQWESNGYCELSLRLQPFDVVDPLGYPTVLSTCAIVVISPFFKGSPSGSSKTYKPQKEIIMEPGAGPQCTPPMFFPRRGI